MLRSKVDWKTCKEQQDSTLKRRRGDKKTLRLPKPNLLYSKPASAELHRKRLAQMALLAQELAGKSHTETNQSRSVTLTRENTSRPQTRTNTAAKHCYSII